VGENLAGRTAVITGASSGIGEATARALAAEGASVALLARRGERIEALAAEIAGAGGKAVACVADVRDRDAVQRAAEAIGAALGPVHTLVNNAGVMLLGPVENAPLTEWQRMININVLGLMYCTHAALPLLLDAAASGPRQVADLINVSSVAGRVARNGSAVYNATKHAVGAFSEALRQEVTKRHLRVSLVEPGAVETELAGHNRPEILARLTERFAREERMQASDISEIISFIVTRPRRTAINEVLVRPTEQDR